MNSIAQANALASCNNNQLNSASQQMGMSAGLSAQGNQSTSLIDRLTSWRKTAQARDKVLEYIEAQLNMDLFKSDPKATEMFRAGMAAAIEVIGK